MKENDINKNMVGVGGEVEGEGEREVIRFRLRLKKLRKEKIELGIKMEGFRILIIRK